MSFTRHDYPLAEHHPDRMKGKRGKPLSELTLDAVLSGAVTIEDLRITPAALQAQADVARSAGRPRLADNFLRAADLVDVPQDVIMEVYELLRPGRARNREQLREAAATMRDVHKAPRIADFIEEAADVYERRGLFSKRF
ncbi:MAG: glycerol dehydratase [Proteobacteria bacterium]|nr:glycerol dehydratase [Pseudomonadota bacterium]